MIVDAVAWTPAACAQFARRLEALVRAECRRDGCPFDDQLAELLFEIVEVGDRSGAPRGADW
jgi:hypothetical protein